MLALVNTPDAENPAEIREVEEPTPAPNEALVEVRAFSINRGELSLLANRPEGWRPGQDIAGVVARAAADGSGPAEGAQVTAVVDEAGWAERAAVPTTRVGVLPDSVSLGAGATLGVAGLTALRALRVGGSLLGARVLVTGASGGVGRFAVQLAHMGGAEVTAVAGSRRRAEGLEDLGAGRIVTDGDDLDGVFDLILEGVGGPSLERSVGVLAPDGVVVLYGASTEEPARIGLFDFAGDRGAGGLGGSIHSFGVYATDIETFGLDLGYLAGLVGEGRLVAPVSLEENWRNLGTAVEALRNRRVKGKAVLSVG